MAVTDEGEEAIVADLNAVDVQDTLRAWDEAEVDGVRNRPDLPAARDLADKEVTSVSTGGKMEHRNCRSPPASMQSWR